MPSNAPEMLGTHKVEMKFTKETKNMVRFDSDADDALVQNIYVRKTAFPSGAMPVSVVVEITGRLH